MANIKYTVPQNSPAKALRGVTLENGVPTQIRHQGKLIEVVSFPNPQDPYRPVPVALEGKPELQAAVDAYRAEKAQEEKEAAARLEANIPGLAELEKASYQLLSERERYSAAFERMMANEANDGARPPRAPKESLEAHVEALRAQFPRAALYLRAKSQAESGGWADNTGAKAAARKAMALLEEGKNLKDAEAALAERREWTD